MDGHVSIARVPSCRGARASGPPPYDCTPLLYIPKFSGLWGGRQLCPKFAVWRPTLTNKQKNMWLATALSACSLAAVVAPHHLRVLTPALLARDLFAWAVRTYSAHAHVASKRACSSYLPACQRLLLPAADACFRRLHICCHCLLCENHALRLLRESGLKAISGRDP